MPRDRTAENKMLDETSAFLEKRFQELRDLEDARKIMTKDYIGLLPARKKLKRLKAAIKNCLEYIDFAARVARSNKFRKDLECGKIKIPTIKPVANIRELIEQEIRVYRPRRDCY